MNEQNSNEGSSATPSRGQSQHNSDDEDTTGEHSRHNHQAPTTNRKVLIVREPERSASGWNSWDNQWQVDSSENVNTNESANGSPRRERVRAAQNNSSPQMASERTPTTKVKDEAPAERGASDSRNGAPLRDALDSARSDDETDIESASQIQRAPLHESESRRIEQPDVAKGREKAGGNLLMNAFNIVQVLPPTYPSRNTQQPRVQDAKRSDTRDKPPRSERPSSARGAGVPPRRTQPVRDEVQRGADRRRRQRSPSHGDDTEDGSVRDDESVISGARSRGSDRTSRRRNSESRELSRNLNKFLQIMLLKEEREHAQAAAPAPAHATASFSQPEPKPNVVKPKTVDDSATKPSKAATAAATATAASAADDQNAQYYRMLEYYQYLAWYSQYVAQNQTTADKQPLISKSGKLDAAPSYVNDRHRNTRQSVSAMSATGSRTAHTDDEGPSAWGTTASVVSEKHADTDAEDALTFDGDRQSDGRATPEKFVRRHACARFARGAVGPLLCVLRPAASDAQSSQLEVVDIRKLQQKAATRNPQSAPAPRLVGNFAFGAFAHCAKAVRSEVLYALQDLARFFAASSFRDHDSAALLCAFLEFLVRKNGALSCADVAQFLLEHEPASPHTLKGWRVAAAAAKRADEASASASTSAADFAKLENSRMSTRLEEAAVGDPDISDIDRSRVLDELDDVDTQSVISTAHDLPGDLPTFGGTPRAADYRRFIAERERRERCVRKFRELILAGKARVALDYAVAHALWPHALFLVQRCFSTDRQLQQAVLARFVERECSLDDPLRTLYELSLGVTPSFSAPRVLLPSASTAMPPAQADSLRFLKANWKLHVAMMVVSLQEALAADVEAQPDAAATVERTLQGIVSLASQFAQANHRFVAQLLYFIAALLRAGAMPPANGSLLNDVVNRDCKLVLLGGATPLALAEFARRTFPDNPAKDADTPATSKTRAASGWAVLSDVRELNLTPANAALRFREACFKTVEIFEYALTLLDGNLYLAGLQQFKYLYMTQLVSCGHSEMAIRYAESLANVLAIDDRDRRQPRTTPRAPRAGPPFPAELAPSVARVAAQLLAYQSRCGPASSYLAKRRLDAASNGTAPLRSFDQPGWFKKLLSVACVPLQPKRPAPVSAPPPNTRSAPLAHQSHSTAPPPAASIQPFEPPPPAAAAVPTFLPQPAHGALHPPTAASFGPPQPASRIQRVSQTSPGRDERLFDMSFQPQPQPSIDFGLDSGRRAPSAALQSNQQQIRDTLNNSIDAPSLPAAMSQSQTRMPFHSQPEAANPPPPPQPINNRERRPTDASLASQPPSLPPPQPQPQSQQQYPSGRGPPSRTPTPLQHSASSRSRSTSGLAPVKSDPLCNIDVQSNTSLPLPFQPSTAPPASLQPPSALPPPLGPPSLSGPPPPSGPPPVSGLPPPPFGSQPSMPFRPTANPANVFNPSVPQFGLFPPPPPSSSQPPRTQSGTDSYNDPDRNESPQNAWDDGDTEPSGDSHAGSSGALEDDHWMNWGSQKNKGNSSQTKQSAPTRANDSAASANASANASTNSRNLSDNSANSANSGWLTGIGSRIKDVYGKLRPPQAHLPDDKNKPLVWDEKTKSWIDTENKSGSDSGLPAPPPPPSTFARRPEPTNIGAPPAAANPNGSVPSVPTMPPSAQFGATSRAPPAPPNLNTFGPPASADLPAGENIFSAQRGLHRGPARSKYATPSYLAQPQPK